MPISLLKECSVNHVPFVTPFFNESLSCGTFQSCWEHASITLVPKKTSSDLHDASSYRPISNLKVLSKILEKLISSQLRQYLEDNCLLPSSQSTYRPVHSTETAILKLTSNILLFLDKRKLCLLCSSLVLTSAFDTIDHEILLDRLQSSFGVSVIALDWFELFHN